MSIGEIAQSIVHYIAIGAWIGFLAPIVILYLRHRHGM